MTRDTRRVLIGFAVLVVAGLMLGVLAAGGGNTPTSAPQENNQPHNGRPHKGPRRYRSYRGLTSP